TEGIQELTGPGARRARVDLERSLVAAQGDLVPFGLAQRQGERGSGPAAGVAEEELGTIQAGNQRAQGSAHGELTALRTVESAHARGIQRGGDGGAITGAGDRGVAVVDPGPQVVIDPNLPRAARFQLRDGGRYVVQTVGVRRIGTLIAVEGEGGRAG